jgi:hemolysin activation/secretion protein
MQDIQQQPPKARSSGEPIIPLRPGSVAPGEADKVTFVLRGVELSGASAISATELAAEWSANIGQTISVAKLYEIVNAVSARYALSFALLPEQDITDGRVKIAVVEGFVDDVVVSTGPSSGSTFSLGHQVEAQMARIKASRPLKTADLERALLPLNDLPGVKARAVFSASKTVSAAPTLTLKVEQDHVQGKAEINNRMSDDLGNWRAGGWLTFNGLVTGTDAITLISYSALDDEGFIFGAGRIEQTLDTDGLLLALNGSYPKDIPLDGVLKTFKFEGESVSGRVDLSYPLIRTRLENLTLAASFSYNDTSTETLGTQMTDDKVRTLEASLTWDIAVRWAGIDLERATLSQSLDVKGASKGASSSFSSERLGCVHYHGTLCSAPPVGFDLVSVFGRLHAAITDTLLVVNERSYGGHTFGSIRHLAAAKIRRIFSIGD